MQIEGVKRRIGETPLRDIVWSLKTIGPKRIEAGTLFKRIVVLRLFLERFKVSIA